MYVWLMLVLLLAGCTRKDEVTSYFKADAKTAGLLKGRAVFVGKRPALRTVDLDQDPDCVRAHGKRVVADESFVESNSGLANVFVYIKSGLEGKAFEPPKAAVPIDQKRCWFQPRIIGIQTSQSLRVSNSDPVTHNIHPMAQINREWNQSQSQGASPLSRRFTRREIMIPVKCNIHGWMRAFIGVVEHPYFAVTGREGAFEIKDVPPGDYTLAAWHEKLGVQEVPITVAASGTVQTAFRFKGE
ncbi:MAG: hypothetical protein WKF37_10490 [Bryobacteraceae bacterium]